MDDSKEPVVAKCSSCDRIFTSHRSLRCHIKIHNERHLTCCFCEKAFNRTDLLFVHALEHLLKEPVKCRAENCDVVVANVGDGERHVASTHSAGIKCCDCSKVQASFRKLLLHHVIQHGELKTFGDEMMAKQRDFLLKKKRETRRKATRMTAEIPAKREKLDEKIEEEEAEKKEKEEEEEGDKVLELLKTAILKADGRDDDADADEMIAKLSEVVAEMFPLTDDNQYYQCVHCAVSFSDAILWMMHLKFHDATEPFLCTGCSRRFSNRQTFQLHLTWFAHGAPPPPAEPVEPVEEPEEPVEPVENI